jgi:hypothetical protein
VASGRCKSKAGQGIETESKAQGQNREIETESRGLNITTAGSNRKQGSQRRNTGNQPHKTFRDGQQIHPRAGQKNAGRNLSKSEAGTHEYGKQSPQNPNRRIKTESRGLDIQNRRVEKKGRALNVRQGTNPTECSNMTGQLKHDAGLQVGTIPHIYVRIRCKSEFGGCRRFTELSKVSLI